MDGSYSTVGALSMYARKKRKDSISEEKQEEICSYFHNTKYTAAEVCKLVGCSHQTVLNYWKERFGVATTKARRPDFKYRERKDLQISDESKEIILKDFDSDLSLEAIGNKIGVSPTTVSNYMKKLFGDEAYRARAKRIMKESRVRSGQTRYGEQRRHYVRPDNLSSNGFGGEA